MKNNSWALFYKIAGFCSFFSVSIRQLSKLGGGLHNCILCIIENGVMEAAKSDGIQLQ